MKRSIIVAMTSSRLIGKDGRLPWHEPEDLKHFKRLTVGHAVIMGRKTFESIGRPLPERRNIVITRNAHLAAPGIDAAPSLDAAFALCESRSESAAFVIGGAQVYAMALPKVDELVVTYVDQPGLTGDTYFPPWDAAEWKIADESTQGHLRFVTYVRK